MHIVLGKNKCPKISISSLQEITSLGLVHGVLIGDINKLKIILSFAKTDKLQSRGGQQMSKSTLDIEHSRDWIDQTNIEYSWNSIDQTSIER